MKYLVQIEGRSFQVEIEDLYARPVIAVVDGKAFEVWPGPEGAGKVNERKTSRTEHRSGGTRPIPVTVNESTTINHAPIRTQSPTELKLVRAPIPGVIVSIVVNVGDAVNVGQELCILEAMKMKNSIRAARAGQIATIHVNIGQQVKHNEPLVEYAE